MIDIYVLLLLLWIHFISDFVFQTNYTIFNKSKDHCLLLVHVVLYGIPFVWFGWEFALATTAVHYIVDWFTTRLTLYLQEKDSPQWILAVIFDQALHISFLFIAYVLFAHPVHIFKLTSL